MIEGVREEAIQAGLAEQAIFDQGIQDLYRTTEADGVFCYTFFKATGFKATGNQWLARVGPISQSNPNRCQCERIKDRIDTGFYYHIKLALLA